MSPKPLILAGLTGLTLLTSCSSYAYRYRFTPRPLESELAVPSRDFVARSATTIVGIHLRESAPHELEVRMRLDNDGSEPFRLVPEDTRLTTADLLAFGVPELETEYEWVMPGESSFSTLWFPLPLGLEPSELDLDSLQLRWTLATESERKIAASATFYQDRRPRFFYPYGYMRGPFYPRFGFGLGFRYSYCRW